MRVTRKPRFWFMSALTALTLATIVAAQAGAQAGVPAQADPAADVPVAAVEDEGLVACDGGAQQRALFRSNDIPTTLGEAAVPVQLPGALVNFVVPGDRQVIVTFAAQAYLADLLPLDLAQPVDSIQVTVLLDGVPMEPADDVTFNTDAGQYDALEACGKVGEGAHTIRVLWRVSDVDFNNALTGTFETWSLHAEINLV